jgi:hypothetical protein
MASATLGPFEIEVTADNRAPVISGAAPAAARVGTLYEFKPTAQGPDGDALRFSIVNKPDWASFNSTSGRLYGTPAAGDVGTFAGVVITVSDGELEDELNPFSITVSDTRTRSATLKWDPPTTNEDGSPLTGLRGFRVYYGVDQTQLTNRVEIANADITSATIEDLEPAKWYFAVRAYTDDGTESRRSNVVSKSID